MNAPRRLFPRAIAHATGRHARALVARVAIGFGAAGADALCARPLTAQSPFESLGMSIVGTTPAGATVYVDPRTVIRRDSRITATVFVRFNRPVPTKDGTMRSMRAIAHFECRARRMALAEDWTFSDFDGKDLMRYERTPVRGFDRAYDPAVRGSLAALSLDHFCGARRRG